MDPVVIAAIITAAGKAAPSLFERFIDFGQSSDKVDRVVTQKYDDLKELLTPPCVKLLVFAEDGSYHDVRPLREHLYPSIPFSGDTEQQRFDGEFAYRLRYLVATGFLTEAMGEYYITRLAGSFLAEARKRRDPILPSRLSR